MGFVREGPTDRAQQSKALTGFRQSSQRRCIVSVEIYNWTVFLDISSELYGYDKDLVLAKVLGRSCLSRLKLTQNFWPSETIRGIVQKSD